MGKPDTSDERAFEERSKALFDASAAELDAATRSRLTRARVRALEELESSRAARWPGIWKSPLLPAGAVAAAVLAALLVVSQRSPEPPPVEVAALGDLELLLGEEDLELIEELEFYAWLEEQPEFDAGAAAGDGVG
jgi:hypothetical protein